MLHFLRLLTEDQTFQLLAAPCLVIASHQDNLRRFRDLALSQIPGDTREMLYFGSFTAQGRFIYDNNDTAPY